MTAHFEKRVERKLPENDTKPSTQERREEHEIVAGQNRIKGKQKTMVGGGVGGGGVVVGGGGGGGWGVGGGGGGWLEGLFLREADLLIVIQFYQVRID